MYFQELSFLLHAILYQKEPTQCATVCLHGMADCPYAIEGVASHIL